MEDIIAAYKKRQDNVKTARFVWKKQYTEVRGSLSEPYKKSSIAKPEKRRTPGIEMKTIPTADTTQAFTARFEMDGENVVYVYEGKEYCWKEDAYILHKSITTFYRGLGKMLSHQPTSKTEHWPRGYIRREPYFIDAGGPNTRVLTLTYRAMSENLRPFDLSQFTITNQRATIDGVSCVELVRETGSGRDPFRLWLAPSRDFCIVRMNQSSGGKIVFQLNVRHSEDPTNGWVPSSWQTINNGPDGKLRFSGNITVTEFSFNHRIPTSTFDLEFPVETHVSDQRSRQQYVVKPSGENRKIEPWELLTNHDELMTTTTGEANSKRRNSPSLLWPRVTILSIAFVAFSIYLFRRARRIKDPVPSQRSST